MSARPEVEDSTTVTGGCDSTINQMLQNNAGGRFRVSTMVAGAYILPLVGST
jgi:hypothetical protein